MKLTVLVDNNTLIDKYLYGEPAVCYLLEHDGLKVLFDIGYSDLFLRNGKKLGKKINDIDKIVLSHGHNDHTGGLSALVKKYGGTDSFQKTTVIGHPDIFYQKYDAFNNPIGVGVYRDILETELGLTINLTSEPLWISNNLVFLGEVPRRNDFENKKPIGTIKKGEDSFPDFLKDDSALVYKSEEGLFIITGCSHSGICNIIEYAKEICRDERIVGIIGGLHLLGQDEQQLDRTVDYLERQNIQNLYPSHCVNLASKITLATKFNVREVGVGLEITI